MKAGRTDGSRRVGRQQGTRGWGGRQVRAPGPPRGPLALRRRSLRRG